MFHIGYVASMTNCCCCCCLLIRLKMDTIVTIHTIIHMEYKHVHTKHIYKYIRINQLQLAINLMIVSIIDLVKPSMLYISHSANN